MQILILANILIFLKYVICCSPTVELSKAPQTPAGKYALCLQLADSIMNLC